MTYTIKQGESKVIEVAVFNDDNVAVDLTLATDIRVILYTKAVAGPKFALNAIVGYGDLNIKVGVGNEHIIEVELTRADTNTFSVGALSASVLTRFTDGVLADGLVSEYISIAMGTITSGGFVKDEVLV